MRTDSSSSSRITVLWYPQISVSLDFIKTTNALKTHKFALKIFVSNKIKLILCGWDFWALAEWDQHSSRVLYDSTLSQTHSWTQLCGYIRNVCIVNTVNISTSSAIDRKQLQTAKTFLFSLGHAPVQWIVFNSWITSYSIPTPGGKSFKLLSIFNPLEQSVR